MGPQLAVSDGAARVATHEVSLGRLTAMTFAAGAELPAHRHPDATIAVILRGGFAGRYDGVERDCLASTLVVEPAGAEHTNRFGPTPTTVVSLSLGDGLLPAIRAAVDRPRFARDPLAADLARQAHDDIARPDDVTPLALEAVALELVTRLARRPAEVGTPTWLRQARDVVHDRYSEPLRLGSVADAVGVEPDRLARAFRRTYRVSLPGYVRRLRVMAAAELLAASDEPSIAAIAAEVGFADQSHLTRRFARLMGTTPARYRAERRRLRER